MTPPPDLETDAGLVAYRAELRRVARAPRWAGFAAVFAGCLVVLAANQQWGVTPEDAIWGYGLLALGWALLVVAFILRSRYHRARMRQISLPGLRT